MKPSGESVPLQAYENVELKANPATEDVEVLVKPIFAPKPSVREHRSESISSAPITVITSRGSTMPKPAGADESRIRASRPSTRGPAGKIVSSGAMSWEPMRNMMNDTSCTNLEDIGECDRGVWWCFEGMSRHVAEKILQVEGMTDGLFLIRLPLRFDGQLVSAAEQHSVKVDVCFKRSIKRLLIDTRTSSLFLDGHPSPDPLSPEELLEHVRTMASAYAPCPLVRTAERNGLLYTVVNVRRTCGVPLARSTRAVVDAALLQRAQSLHTGSYAFWEDADHLGW